jgi:hypothetical protein
MLSRDCLRTALLPVSAQSRPPVIPECSWTRVGVKPGEWRSRARAFHSPVESCGMPPTDLTFARDSLKTRIWAEFSWRAALARAVFDGARWVLSIHNRVAEWARPVRRGLDMISVSRPSPRVYRRCLRGVTSNYEA